MGKQFIWSKGDKDRPLELCRPCPCGCDKRDGAKGVGYLCGSDKDGNGFTIWIDKEDVFRAIKNMGKIHLLE